MVGNSYSDSRTDLFLVSVYFVDGVLVKNTLLYKLY